MPASFIILDLRLFFLWLVNFSSQFVYYIFHTFLLLQRFKTVLFYQIRGLWLYRFRFCDLWFLNGFAIFFIFEHGSFLGDVLLRCVWVLLCCRTFLNCLLILLILLRFLYSSSRPRLRRAICLVFWFCVFRTAIWIWIFWLLSFLMWDYELYFDAANDEALLVQKIDFLFVFAIWEVVDVEHFAGSQELVGHEIRWKSSEGEIGGWIYRHNSKPFIPSGLRASFFLYAGLHHLRVVLDYDIWALLREHARVRFELGRFYGYLNELVVILILVRFGIGHWTLF